MALRLAKNINQDNKNKRSGFELKFTEGITYNLDELLAEKNRMDGDRALVIEVKKSKEVAEQAMAAILTELRDNFISSIDREEITDSILKIISEVYHKYGCDYRNISAKAESELNYNVNKYLREKTGNNELSYTIKFTDMDNLIEINYTFVDNNILNKYFVKYYESYLLKYKSIESDISEGALAISDRRGKVRVNTSDYAKYLLDKDGRSYSNKTPMDTGVSYSKIKIMWEEGTADDTTPDQVESVYDDIRKLEEQSKILQEQLDKISSNDLDFSYEDGILYIDSDNVDFRDGVLYLG